MKQIIITESQLSELIKSSLFKNLLNEQELITIKAKTPSEFYKKVKKESKKYNISTKTISVVMSSTGECSITFKTTKSKSKFVVHIPFSEESDKGECPSCKTVREKNPKGKIIKVDGSDFGSFGKKRKFQIIAVPISEKDCKKNYSQNAINILLSDKAESFRSQVYDDKCPNAPYPSKTDSRNCGGALTIGYGTLVSNHPELAVYKKGSMYHLSKESALKYLKDHVDKEVVPHINEKINVCLSKNQFDALTVFTYNVKIGENLQKAINDEDEESIRYWWRKYIYAGTKVMPGLVKRREEELKLFFT